MLRFLGLSRDESVSSLPSDKLQVKHLISGKGVFQARSGVPATSDSLAYEPVQHLLAVATSDGRIVLAGKDGVQRTVYSSGNKQGTPTATQQLLFLINKGGLVRLGQDGSLELFAVDPNSSNADDPSQPLDVLTVPEDQVCCIAALQHEPYILLGCASGAVRVAGLVNASGEIVTATRQVRGLALLPYTIPARKLDATGPVIALRVQSHPPYQNLLVLHKDSGAAIWDLKAQLLVARVSSGSASNHKGNTAEVQGVTALNHGSGQVSAVAWLHGSAKGDFVTGHTNGDINVWSLPESSSKGANWRDAVSEQQLLQPALACQLRVTAGSRPSSQQQRTGSPSRSKSQRQLQRRSANGQRCKPVQSLQYIGMGRAEGLLVVGGGDDGQPDGLVLLPLPEPKISSGIEDPTTSEDQQQTAAAASLKLPWLGFIVGHALVPKQGSITGHEEPSAVIVLLEGGEVITYDLSAFAAAASSTAAPLETAAALGDRSQGRSSSISPTRRPHQQLQQQGSRSSSPSGMRDQPQQQQGHSRDNSSQAAVAELVVPQRLFAQQLQGQPLVTAARLRIIPIQRVPLQGLQGACMNSLLDWAAHNAAAALKAADAASTKWVVAGGKLALPPSACSSKSAGSNTSSNSSSVYATLYCTGHADGGVRLWAMHGEAPQLLGMAPSAAAHKALQKSGAGTAAPISTLEFAWEQGLLISGHEGGEVRVYQFSEAHKKLECVMFESVGSRSNNEGLVVEEPSGFQLRLMTRLHSADIVSSTYLPQFKMVAVSDRSGSVSLIDLAKPAVLWYQAPWSHQPVVSLAMGNVPMPHSRDRHPALMAAMTAHQKVPAGAPVRAVVAVAADSQLAVMDAATGFFLSRASILVPKHSSPALHVELLNESGAPTWISRDVQDLIDLMHAQQPKQQHRQQHGQIPDLHNSSSSATASATTAAAGRGSLHVPESSAAEQGSEDELESDSEGSEGSVETEEADVNELLAMAAAEVDAQDSRATGRRKHKTKSKHKPGSMQPAYSRGCSKSQNKQGLTDSHEQEPGLRPVGASTGSLPDSDTATNMSTVGSSNPIVLSEPMAGYVLTATRDYLRLYPIARAVSGDRTTARRVCLPGPLQFVSSFAASGAPALVCLLELEGEVHLQIYTLPRLELVRDMPLSSLLGWKWSWDPRHTAVSGATGAATSSCQAQESGTYDPYSTNLQQQQQQQQQSSNRSIASTSAAATSTVNTRLAAVCAATRHGHLALLGPGSELIRLALAAGAGGAPLPPLLVYDWDLATAAHAAGAAMEKQQLHAWAVAAAAASAASRNGGGDAAGLKETSAAAASDETAADDEDASDTAVAAVGGVGNNSPGNKFKGLMNKIGGDLQKAGGEVARGLKTALDETQKGLQKVAQVIETELVIKPIQPPQLPEYPHPTLSEVFGLPTHGDTVASSRKHKASTPTTAAGLGCKAPAQGKAASETDAVQVAAAAYKTAKHYQPAMRDSASPAKQRQKGSAVGSGLREEGVFERPESPDYKSAALAASGHAAFQPVPATTVASSGTSLPVRVSNKSPGPAVLNETAARAELFSSPAAGSKGSSSLQQQLRRISPVPGSGGPYSSNAATTATAGGSKLRTADEIRQAYGRPALRANETRGVMEETREALVQRGERLSRLQEQTADLADSAAGFAELAKQLAEKEKAKTKWFG